MYVFVCKHVYRGGDLDCVRDWEMEIEFDEKGKQKKGLKKEEQSYICVDVAIDLVG